MAQAATYPALPGVSDAAPARRVEVPLQSNRTATALALDTARVHDGMLLRSDLTDTAPDRLLPAGTRRVGLELSATTVSGRAGAPAGEATSVAVTLEDRYGIAYHQTAGELPVDGRVHRLALNLGKAPDPLRLTAVELVTDQHLDTDAEQKVVLRAVRAGAADGSERPVALTGTRWRTVLPQPETAGDDTSARPAAPAAPPAVHRSGAGLSFTYRTGFVTTEENSRYMERPTTSLLLAVDRRVPLTVPAVATERCLTSTGLRRGGTMDVPVPTGTVRVRIAETIRALPTTGGLPAERDGGALLFDLRAANLALTETGSPALDPDEWWLTTRPGQEARTAAAARELPGVDASQVIARAALVDALRDDPLGAGPQSALSAAALVAAALAAVGFAVNIVGSLRERGDEIAVLTALGASRRRLTRLVAAEQGVLVAIGLLVGAALGAFLTRAIVPLIVLTGDAARPVPDVLVQLPLSRVALLLCGVALTPVLIIAALALRRPPRPASVLRTQGGE
jgi:hypothetical protein